MMRMNNASGRMALVALMLMLTGLVTSGRAHANCAAVNVSAYGAFPNDGVDDTAAIQAAINAQNIICFSEGTYLISSTITVPQARNMIWLGAGFRSTSLQISAGVVGFSYTRASGAAGSTLNISDMQFVEAGLGKGGTAVRFHGFNTTFHDNWLRMTDCSIFGFNRGVHLKFAGQCHFVGVYAQANNSVYFLERDSSFIYFDRCMNLSNNNFVWADDTLADGISNGIFMTQCSSVAAAGLDVRILGWQAIFIDQCGFDLGSAGQAAVYFNACQDFHIISSWIASDPVAAPSRYGIWMQGINHSASITDNSIVNNRIGVRFDGVAGAQSAKLSIHGNKFEANATNDILFVEGRGIKITNNSFISTPSHTGTNYEVYGNTTGSNYCIVKDNTFRLGSYPIVIGGSSIVSDNIFSVPM